MASFSLLPTETLLNIFPYVHPGSLVAFSSVNQRIHELSSPFLDEHHRLHAQYASHHLYRDAIPDLAAAIINNPRIGYYIRSLRVCRLRYSWPELSQSPHHGCSALDVDGNVLGVDHEHRAFLVETFHRALTKLGYGLFAGFVDQGLTVDDWKQEIFRGNHEAMVAITLPYLSNLERFSCQAPTSSSSILHYAFEYVVESRVRSGRRNPDYNLPSMMSTGPFDSLKCIDLTLFRGAAATSTAQLLRLFDLPSLEELRACRVRPTLGVKEIDGTKDVRSDIGQNIMRLGEADKSKLPLKSLTLFYSCIGERDLSAMLDRTESDKLETFSYTNIPHNWPGFSASKHVVSLLNHSKRSLRKLRLGMQNRIQTRESYFGSGDVSSDDDVLNNHGWAVGMEGFREFHVLGILDVSAEIILGGYGRWYNTPMGRSQMLANKPASDERKLVDLLPQSLKSLTIKANSAQWPLVVERVESLLRDNHDVMDNLEIVDLVHLNARDDTPSAEELEELCELRGFTLSRCAGWRLQRVCNKRRPVNSIVDEPLSQRRR